MEARRVTNSLLLVIALCLVLIVLKLYDLEVVQDAHANESPGKDKVGMLGWDEDNSKWQRIAVDSEGRLILSGKP